MMPEVTGFWVEQIPSMRDGILLRNILYSLLYAHANEMAQTVGSNSLTNSCFWRQDSAQS